LKRFLVDVWLLLTARERRALTLLALLSFLTAALDLLGVGLIVPFLALVAKPALAAEVSERAPWLGSILPQDQSKLLTNGLVLLVGLYLLKGGLQLAVAWAQTRFVARWEGGLSIRLFDLYLRQPWVFHTQRNSAELLAIIFNDSYKLSFMLMALVSMLADLITIVSLVALMSYVEPVGTSAVAALLVIAASALMIGSRGRLARWGAARLDLETQRWKLAQETISAIREVQLFTCESLFANAFRMSSFQYAHVIQRTSFVGQVPRLSLEVVAVLAVTSLTLVLLGRGKTPVEILPIVGMFAASATRLLPAFTRIVGSTQVIRTAQPALDRVVGELRNLNLAEPSGSGPDVVPLAPVAALEAAPVRDGLVIHDLWFRYPGAVDDAIKGVSLEVMPGEMVGLVGTSGSGKSTLMDLLLGLLTPSRGTINFGGRDIYEEPTWWRGRIGYVPQTILLTDDTLRRNVAFGVADEEIDDAAVRRALHAASLGGFVAALPNGLDTVIGERGSRLSGGQRQRIGIARALYRDPEFLVLDEATSALDGATEAEVMQAINGLQGKKTLLIVAHRLTTIERCDRVVRLEAGRLVSGGSDPSAVL
jgi:ABC-type multidrug transport system fused ATPase/permease subunit